MSEPALIRLRYPGNCISCRRPVAAGERAAYDRGARAVTCARCAVDAAAAADKVPSGRPGASAQAEHDRRRRARERRAQARFGVFGRAIVTLAGDIHREQAWAKGAAGERKVARHLEKTLRGSPVLLLHDRRIPGTRANIDHLAVGPGGVTVIDAKHYKGKVRSETRGGLIRPRTEHLLIDGHDRTDLVDGLQHQLQTVGEIVGPRVEVRGALCLADADGLPLLAKVRVDGIPVLSTGAAAKLALRPGDLTGPQVTELHALLASTLPEATAR